MKILKLRDSLGMSYPEAKAVHVNLGSSHSSADPLDVSRLKLQEIINRCNNLVLAGRKQTYSNNLLIETVNKKSVKINELKKALEDQKVAHKMEVDELSEKINNHLIRHLADIEQFTKYIELITPNWKK